MSFLQLLQVMRPGAKTGVLKTVMLNKEKGGTGGFPAVRPCGPLWGLFRGRVGYLRHQEVLGRFGPAFAGDIRRGLDDEKKAAGYGFVKQKIYR